jgi:5'-3' exoribonuclease 2
MSRDARAVANAISGSGSQSNLNDDQTDEIPAVADKEDDVVSNDAILPVAVNSAEDAHGVKRKFDETEEDVADSNSADEDAAPATALALKVNPDGTVEQEDTVKCVI